jgi:hypothetical protein
MDPYATSVLARKGCEFSGSVVEPGPRHILRVSGQRLRFLQIRFQVVHWISCSRVTAYSEAIRSAVQRAFGAPGFLDRPQGAC